MVAANWSAGRCDAVALGSVYLLMVVKGLGSADLAEGFQGGDLVSLGALISTMGLVILVALTSPRRGVRVRWRPFDPGPLPHIDEP